MSTRSFFATFLCALVLVGALASRPVTAAPTMEAKARQSVTLGGHPGNACGADFSSMPGVPCLKAAASVDGANAWQLATSAAGWGARSMVCALTFNNRLWVLGGYHGDYYNDAWCSGDGVNWSQITAAAPWGARNGHAAAVLNGKLYLMGGYGYDILYNDVWSTRDGVNWTQETAAAPWGARWAPRALAFNNKLWVLGGFTGSSYYNDVWSSSDGVTWTRVTGAAPWAPRDLSGAEVYDGKLWIMGGWDGANSFNDVWSSKDGVNWTQTAASAPWRGRRNFASVVADDGKMWILGGYDSNTNTYLKDAWYTLDGTNWTQSMLSVPWTARSGLAGAAFQNCIYITGGANVGAYQDVWYLPVSRPAGVDVTPESGLAASGTPGGPFRPASVTYTLTNITMQALAWTAGKTQNWVTLSKTGGTLAVGQTDTVTVSINAGANALGIGNYTDSVIFSSTSAGAWSSIRSVSLAVNDPAAWQLATGEAPWQGGLGHATVVFRNKLWILGGLNGSWHNEVWSSGDGVNWSQAPTPPWGGRYDHQAVVLNDKIFVLGGYGSYSYYGLSDVWCSSDGLTWTQLTAGAPWGPRYGMRALAFNGKLWVLGGCSTASLGRNDVWSSVDGVTWTQEVSSAPWETRRHLSGEVFGGRMWIMGGYGFNGPLNDVWSSSDGITWTQATASAAWTNRYHAASAVVDNKLWLVGGQLGNWGINEVWSSSDGVNWTQSPLIVPWAGRYGLGAVNFLDRLYLTGGYTPSGGVYHDVWFLRPTLPTVPTLDVTPGTDFSATGSRGGPFPPASVTYIVKNTGPAPLAWTASRTHSWLTLSKTGGTLAAGAYDTVVAALSTAVANTMAYGSYSDTISFTNTTNGQGNVTRAASLVVQTPPTLAVTAAAGLTATGNIGGPFSPNRVTYTITNTGDFPLVWKAVKGKSWLTLSRSDGSLAPKSSDTVTGSINPSASLLAAGRYSDTVSFTNTTNGLGNTTRPVSLTLISAALSVTPTTGLTASCLPGGPCPGSTVYTLRNTGSVALTWTAAKTFAWVGLSKSSGTLAPGASDTVKVSIDSRANGLAEGYYPCNVCFTNTTTGAGSTTRMVSLTVSAGLGSWQQVTPDAAWPAREGHTLVAFRNKLWLLGGSASDTGIWSSTDGVNWSRAATNGPLDRSYMGVAILGGKLWITGGMDRAGTIRRDVWSSADGTHWNRATAAASWPARYGHQTLSYGGKLWVLGGTTSGNSFLRDVWSSSDGMHWSRATATAGWEAMTNFAAFDFGGKLWVVGDGGSGLESWFTTDGVTWIPGVTLGELGSHYCFASAVYKGRLWVLGGMDLADTTGNWLRRDVWSSADGMHWTRSTAPVPWAARYSAAAAALGDKLWLAGGNISEDGTTAMSDVWQFGY